MSPRTIAAWQQRSAQLAQAERDARDRERDRMCRTQSGGYRFDLTRADLEDDHDG